MRRHMQAGFTLIEMVVVIAITAIVAAMVAIFIRAPLQAYVDTARRVELADIADAAVRRTARDIQSALPNSIRVDPTRNFLEFLPVATAGRYRASPGAGGAGNPLDFGLAAPDAGFDVLGPAVNVSNGDRVAIYNLGIAGASDAYDGTSTRAVTAPFGAVTAITFAPAGVDFPFASPGNRFQVINLPVSYVCAANNGNPSAGVLLRYSGYPIQANQPTTVAALDALVAANPATATKAVVAGNVSVCSLSNAVLAQQHLGLVTLYVELFAGGETVRLQHQINVDNTP